MPGVVLTSEDQDRFAEGRKGNWDAFTEYYFRPGGSDTWFGTWYTPEDHVENYSILKRAWDASNRPDHWLKLKVDGHEIDYRVRVEPREYEGGPQFLQQHGYIILPWLKEALAVRPDVLVATGGRGAAKTAGVGIVAGMYNAIYPGFDFFNLAPTIVQANDMSRELTKWITNSEFERFIVRPKSGNILRQDAGRYVMTIDCGLGTYSTFTCITIGEREADQTLGSECHWVNIDEAAMVGSIDEVQVKLVASVRGSDRRGVPRFSIPSMSFITNQQDNPAFDRLAERAKAAMKDPESDPLRWAWTNPEQDDNIYLTVRQKRLHRGMMSGAQANRWLKGDSEIYQSQGLISRQLINLCYDPTLDREIEVAKSRGQPFEYIDGIGITWFELEPQLGHVYIPFGDPGTSNLVSIDSNNLPVTGVMDITGFPKGRCTLAGLRMQNGNGKWEPWASEMVRLMDKYSAPAGCYDATASQRILSEFPLANYPSILPVSMAGNGKAIARTFFILMAGRGYFRWPFLDTLWYQARRYKERGEGLQQQPDDIIAALFVFSWYLRFMHYTELPEELRATQEAKDEIVEALKRQAQTVPSRYARREHRYRRL